QAGTADRYGVSHLRRTDDDTTLRTGRTQDRPASRQRDPAVERSFCSHVPDLYPALSPWRKRRNRGARREPYRASHRTGDDAPRQRYRRRRASGAPWRDASHPGGALAPRKGRRSAALSVSPGYSVGAVRTGLVLCLLPALYRTGGRKEPVLSF